MIQPDWNFTISYRQLISNRFPDNPFILGTIGENPFGKSNFWVINLCMSNS